MKTLSVISVFVYLTSLLSAQGPAAWDQSIDYTHPALVIDGTTTYLSIKNVPANTDITNTTYWSTLDSLVPKETPSGSDSLTTPDASEVEDLDVPDSAGDSSVEFASGTPRIVRISVRGHIGTGDDERFMAFKTSGTSEVMVRAIGPALGDLAESLKDVSLLDPEMTMYSGSTSIPENSNDDYTSRSESAQIASLSSSFYPSIPIKNVESASIAEYTSGTYSSNVRDKSYSSSYGTRIGWVGIDMTETNSTSGLLNVATRGIVKPGDGAMFAAFEIVGDADKTRKIFLRGRGASLAKFGVSNVLSNIMLNLYEFDTTNGGATLILGNKDYTTETNSDEIATTAQSLLGQPLDAKDPGMILDLKPGYYTINIESESGNTGNAWLGIDDITE